MSIFWDVLFRALLKKKIVLDKRNENITTMTTTPTPSLTSLLLRMQFYLMELALHERDLDFLLVDLENIMNKIHEYYRDVYIDISSAFEELQTHFATKNRFVLGTKLQIAIASHQNFPKINTLKPYLDQIERHLHAQELPYYLSLFQIALITPKNLVDKKLSLIAGKIKQHYPNREYINDLYEELMPYYS